MNDIYMYIYIKKKLKKKRFTKNPDVSRDLTML